MSAVGQSIQAGKGVVSDTGDGVRFGGSYAFSASGSEPARVEITVWDGRSVELDVTLQEGDTFQIAGQTWRLDKIHMEGVRRWYADLTRIA